MASDKGRNQGSRRSQTEFLMFKPCPNCILVLRYGMNTKLKEISKLKHGHRHLVFHMIPTSGGVDQIIPLVQKADDGGSEPRVDNYYISLRYTVEHGDFAVANCSVSLSVIGKLISRWTTAITVDHHGLGGSR
ncbi:hypothetical protein DPMN_061348 [Dreissena polymorpha]|uniref:Uncharacterized protein n=1 Tax=Dreissena polymorpha TaxID=45954 RepID=A0A9D4C7P4_DREPO|nr:hypothetical protein DPMN_061348 [Dreissena polymorpha]